MTVKEFLQNAVGYFGIYRATAMTWVADYLGQYSPTDLDALWKRVLLSYSGRWNYPPDIAVLEEAAKELDMASPGYSRLAWLPKAGAKALPPGADGEELPPEVVQEREKGADILANWRKEQEGK